MTEAAQTGVSPELSVRRGREAVEFYKAAFGAVEIYRVGGTDEHEEVVAQLSVGHPSGSPTTHHRTSTSAPNRWAAARCDCYWSSRILTPWSSGP
jgi:hypothetical protein